MCDIYKQLSEQNIEEIIDKEFARRRVSRIPNEKRTCQRLPPKGTPIECGTTRHEDPVPRMLRQLRMDKSGQSDTRTRNARDAVAVYRCVRMSGQLEQLGLNCPALRCVNGVSVVAHPFRYNTGYVDILSVDGPVDHGSAVLPKTASDSRCTVHRPRCAVHSFDIHEQPRKWTHRYARRVLDRAWCVVSGEVSQS